MPKQRSLPTSAPTNEMAIAQTNVWHPIWRSLIDLTWVLYTQQWFGLSQMDELINKLAGMGTAGLVLIGLVATSSYTGAVAITTSLAFLGGPFGMIGGAIALTLIAAISSMITKVGVETLAKALVKKLKENGQSAESIIRDINKFPVISKGLKAQLREYVQQT